MNAPVGITDEQRDRLDQYAGLLAHFNKRINLISSHTAGDIWKRHIAHSLTLACHDFPAESRVVDWGTGGGLPLIPMAICFPDTHFIGVDAVGKKVQAVRAMARKLGLINIELWHGRAEQWPDRAHYSISRATASLVALWEWHSRVVDPLPAPSDACWGQGVLCLKGGDLEEEIAALKASFVEVDVIQIPLDPMLRSPLFSTKCIVHVISRNG